MQDIEQHLHLHPCTGDLPMALPSLALPCPTSPPAPLECDFYPLALPWTQGLLLLLQPQPRFLGLGRS